jgi:sulfur carrier protein
VDLSNNSDEIAQIQIHLNGELRDCGAGLSLTEFLVELGLNPRLVAVEYNGEILARSQWDSTIIQGDDRLEIVTIVGGG